MHIWDHSHPHHQQLEAFCPLHILAPGALVPFRPASCDYLSKSNGIKPSNLRLTAAGIEHRIKTTTSTGQIAEVSFKELHCHPLAHHLHLSAILFLHVIFHGLFQIWNSTELFITVRAAFNAKNSNHGALCGHSGNQHGLANLRFPEVEPASSALELVDEIPLLAKGFEHSRTLANGHYPVVVIFGAGGYNFDFIFLMSPRHWRKTKKVTGMTVCNTGLWINTTNQGRQAPKPWPCEYHVLASASAVGPGVHLVWLQDPPFHHLDEILNMTPRRFLNFSLGSHLGWN